MLFIVDVYKIWQSRVLKLATREEEAYRGMVNNLSQAPHVSGLIREKFNEAQLGAFRAFYLATFRVRMNWSLSCHFVEWQIKGLKT